MIKQGIRRGGGRKAGMSLLEMSCALFIVTMGLFGVIQMYMTGISNMKTLSEKQVAMRAAENEIETLRALPFAELVPGAALPLRAATAGTEKLHNLSGTVDIAAPDGAPDLREVHVCIEWTGEHGRRIRQELTTLIADKGGARS